VTRVVAVFGAGGFVGATCVEHLLARGSFEVRPFIYST
jgi:nucleoside-diphosphate-sugar epimerase